MASTSTARQDPCRPPPPRTGTVSPATIARVSAWAPEGQQCTAPCDALSPDRVVTIGICQSVPFLSEGWKQYLAKEKEDPALVAAFTQAFALCVRRCPSALEPLIRQLVEHATAASLTADVCVRLSYLITDLGNKDIATIFMQKANTIPDLPRSFYMSMLRLATEALTPVDMDLALDVTEQMTRAGYVHCTISLRLLLSGMSRLPSPPVDTAIRIFKFKMDGKESTVTADPCFANAFFNLLENATGAEAVKASEYLQSLHSTSSFNCIANACPYVPCLTRKGCFNACDPKASYILADPLTVDFGGAPEVPEGAYVVFLYSSLRQLELRATNLCNSSPYHKKLADVKRFLSTVENASVIPFAAEIAIRGNMEVSSERPSSYQDRFLLFLAQITNHCDHKCSVLSNDSVIIKDATEHGVPIRSTICSPSSSSAPHSNGNTPRSSGVLAPLQSPPPPGPNAPIGEGTNPHSVSTVPRLNHRHHRRF